MAVVLAETGLAGNAQRDLFGEIDAIEERLERHFNAMGVGRHSFSG